MNGPANRRGRALIAGAAIVVLVIAGFAVGPLGGSGGAEGGGSHATEGMSLASVERGALRTQVYESGTLGYAARPDGSPHAIVNQATGAFTALPSAGDVVRCGEPLYRTDDVPVLLLCGSTPAYRTLWEGSRGPDVRVLNRNLVRLGYATREEIDPSSDHFGATTAVALAALQEERGIDATGSLAVGQAVFLPGPLRITDVLAALGAPAQPGEPVALATSTEREVVVELSASQRATVSVGDGAEVTLPSNETTPGEVSRIGAAVTSSAGEEGGGNSGSGSSNDRIPVYVTLDRPRDARLLDEAPVRVEITTGEVEQALSVPVTALLARAGGGFAIEVVDERTELERELVPVELGVFDQANGLVEVRAEGLEAGQHVVVPST